ncbi:MAG: ABC transporter substrate-binding protein [Balneolaceae bacterium]|nr:ABC transporter substrate-binding protein [Balneolaceae bacterium]
MKLLKRITIALFTLLLMSGVAYAQEDSTSIKNMLEQRDQQIKDLLGPKGTEYTQSQRDQIKDVINGVIDYRAMAKYALEGTFDTLSTEQQDEFVDLFSTTIRDQSLNKLDIYRANVTYNSIDVNGDKAKVSTLAVLENVRTPVIYDMHYSQQEGQWVVTDLTVDDVSTAASYRRQFQNIIRKRGYDFLLETLRKRAAR